MAVAVGTIVNVYDIDEVPGRSGKVGSSADTSVKTCKVAVKWVTGSYATADDANFAAATAIQNCRKNGKTVTVRRVCAVSSGTYYTSAAPTTLVRVVAGDFAVTTGTALGPLIQADLSTELTNATDLTTLTWTAPIVFQVEFTELD